MRFLKKLSVASCLVALSTVHFVHASTDGGSSPTWSLANPHSPSVSSAIISPGNDTRSNMLLLLRDRVGTDNVSIAYQSDDSGYSYGRNYFSYYTLADTFYAQPAATQEAQAASPVSSELDFGGSRCQTYYGGTRDIENAMEAAISLPEAERTAILSARQALSAICSSVDALNGYYNKDNPPQVDLSLTTLNPQVSSKAGKEFVSYFNGAAAFYAGEFERADEIFTGLNTADDQWVKETAAYMVGRNAINQAQLNSIDNYGSYDAEKVDVAVAETGRAAFEAYLKRYPNGRYAMSAKGLIRRALWLSRSWNALSKNYATSLAEVDVTQDTTRYLLQEADLKLLFVQKPDRAAITDPLLLAISDLERMRGYGNYEDQPYISRADIDAQAPLFKGQEALFSFIQANHAYYVAHDAKEILSLIPDAAQQDNFSYLEFSRQALRGMALAALKDPNEPGFWREMLPGAKAIYQRPMVELGLAINLEKTGQVNEVFARDTVINDPMIRKILIGKVAGPALLKRQSSNPTASKSERSLALFTLLHKSLAYGRYDDFVQNVPLAKTDLSEYWSLWHVMSGDEEAPSAVFRSGKVAEDYPCAPLATSVAALADNPKDIKARLCLGEFWRLNGFDDFYELDGYPSWQTAVDKQKEASLLSPALGDSRSQFPGTKSNRHDFYTDIIANPKAQANDRAYALYRAVYCYAPGGYNSCGGKEVDKSRRQAWFNQLKRDYPDSEWAESLRYYW